MVAWEKITCPKSCGGLGLRDVTVLNQAMTLKVLWKLASKEYEGTLWVQVLTVKYLSKAPLWLADKPSRCSKLWAAVLEAREVLKPHIKWIIGNGERCSLVGEPWHEFWLHFLQLTRGSFAGYVKDFIDIDSVQWDTGKLVQVLGLHAALYIVCVFQQPPLKHNSRDRLIFKPAASGNFSFKGACDMIEAAVNQSPVDSGIWKIVWKCSDEDDAMHALFLCTRAKQCWLASDLGLRVDVLPQQARCKEVYEGKKIVIQQVLRDACSLHTLTKCIGGQSRRRGITINNTTHSIRQIPVIGKYCKMDGSYKEGGGAGWAYTFYENNELIQYGIRAGDATSPLHAELLALNAALHDALLIGWLEAIFYTDCEVISKVLNGVLPPEAVDWRVYLLFLDIISVFKQHENLICCYAPRELLTQEHELANIARVRELNVTGYTFPWFQPQ
ncbi:hypothetical protein LUZ63_016159 [Rhynchospora breviuscula]|uniref:RNase H type-1 domain-containing protein n=1 Tax=Rhynchospora breviuscula TaxID=2022672 RepID=A0A9Q0CDM7_9POAL|nr:hypothetical protein LUZ63_016159 [Rhynchospora breviuscula]